MLDNTIIKQLKQTNVSADSEKTAQRVEALWKSAKNVQKKEVCELADSAVSTIYRVYNTGHISAKLAVALAQVLGANPFYLTAESDEQEGSGDAVLREFLTAHGYAALLPESEPEPKRRRAPRTRRVKEEAEEAEEEMEAEVEAAVLEAAIEAEIEDEIEAEAEAEIEIELDDGDILTLIHALHLKAACGAESAAAALKKLYGILLG